MEEVSSHHVAVHSVVFLSIAGPETMYMYKGKDYSKASESDKKSFDQLLAGNQQQQTV